MIRPLLSLKRLSFWEKEDEVSYRYGKEDEEEEGMDYLEFIARVTSHIPDRGLVTVRYYGLYANAHHQLPQIDPLGSKTAPVRIGSQELLIAAEAGAEYFS